MQSDRERMDRLRAGLRAGYDKWRIEKGLPSLTEEEIEEHAQMIRSGVGGSVPPEPK